jgi:hypothetical protein
VGIKPQSPRRNAIPLPIVKPMMIASTISHWPNPIGIKISSKIISVIQKRGRPPDMNYPLSEARLDFTEQIEFRDERQ